MQLQIVHHKQVAALEINDSLAHLKAAGAADGTEKFQPVVPGQPLAGREGFVEEGFDGEWKLRVQRQAVMAKGVHQMVNAVRFETQPRGEVTDRVDFLVHGIQVRAPPTASTTSGCCSARSFPRPQPNGTGPTWQTPRRTQLRWFACHVLARMVVRQSQP